jgi:hypothetical protein
MTSGPLYQSPPGSGTNNGALPTTYDPTWQNYINLTPAQVVAFQSFPQDLLRYLQTRRWLAEISGITINNIPLTTQYTDQAKIAQLKQAFDNGAITGPVSFFDAQNNIRQVNATAATVIYNAMVTFVQSVYTTAATLQNGINATPPTITTRAQIDAAIAAIAPNSPSAKGSG